MAKHEIKRWVVGPLFLATSLAMLPAAWAATYDLVINGGRVMDPETMYDDIANVGIKDGRIAAITQDKITGKDTIDAQGLVVAPGFIDTHYHAVDPFGVRMALRDGVTTGMDLEQGATSIAEWYAAKQQTGWPINYGATVMMIGARLLVHDPEVKIDKPIDMSNLTQQVNAAAKDGRPGWSVERSNIGQMNRVMQIMDEGLREGALGLGVGAAYMAPGMTSYEQFEAQRLAARYGRLTAVHTRFHMSTQTPTEAPIGFDEVLANAMLLKAPLLLCHDNDYGCGRTKKSCRWPVPRATTCGPNTIPMRPARQQSPRISSSRRIGSKSKAINTQRPSMIHSSTSS